jgi:hypothetical protein
VSFKATCDRCRKRVPVREMRKGVCLECASAPWAPPPRSALALTPQPKRKRREQIRSWPKTQVRWCAHCHVLFVPTRGGNITCGGECHKASEYWRRAKADGPFTKVRACVICGQLFGVGRGKGVGKQVACSDICKKLRYKALKGPREAARKRTPEHKARTKELRYAKPVTCRKCGRAFLHQQAFDMVCPQCKWTEAAEKAGRAFYRRWKQEWKQCKVCGESKDASHFYGYYLVCDRCTLAKHKGWDGHATPIKWCEWCGAPFSSIERGGPTVTCRGCEKGRRNRKRYESRKRTGAEKRRNQRQLQRYKDREAAGDSSQMDKIRDRAVRGRWRKLGAQKDELELRVEIARLRREVRRSRTTGEQDATADKHLHPDHD